MRIACGVEFDGSRFYGWQTQDGVRTVQETIEKAVSKVADHAVDVVAAGRTDAGVHGRGMVFHFDTEAVRSPRAWVMGSNNHLPDDVSLLWAMPVEDEFHARFGARGRAYRYEILNRGSRSPLMHKRATWLPRPLDMERMQAAGNYLLGKHDFTSLRTVHCQAKSPVRTLRRLQVTREGNLLHIDVAADGFLHHMVRNIAGVLMAVGYGDREPEWAKEVLDARDRRLGGVTAPAEGLYFMQVDYDACFNIPAVTAASYVNDYELAAL